jgi:hypothetical protein
MARELLLIALVAACDRDRPVTSEPATAPAAGAPPLASKAFYRVDAPPAVACTRGTTCEARLVLTALGDYHINHDYPFKFVGEPAPALALDGDAAFALADAKHGALTVRFKPTAAGAQTLAGVFKLSVCSDDTCEIERPRLELPVTVR